MIGAIILAAGASRRFGHDKRRARLPGGKFVIQQVIENTRLNFDSVLVVLRHDDETFKDDLERLLFDPGLAFYRAPDSAMGMGHSLANAIGEVGDWDGAFVFLADMPRIQQPTLRSLKTAFKENQAQQPIVVPTFNGQYGHPVGFHSAYFEEIATLTGDQGAKPVMQQHAANIIEVPVEDAGVVVDIDRPEDLEE